MNLKVNMNPEIHNPEINHMLSIDLMDNTNPQFTLYFFGDACKDKDIVKQRLDELVNMYVSTL